MAIGSSNQPNFNIQTPAGNQSLVYDSSQNAFINANISVTGTVTGGINVGTGSQSFKSLVGTDLSFRSIVAGTGVTVTQNANDITLSATGAISTVGNLGAGKNVFAQISSGNLQLRSLTVGTGLAVSNTATEINIAVDTANMDAGTLGGNAASVFLTKADNLASVGSIATARTNLDVFSKTEANTSFQRKDADYIPDADNSRSLGTSAKRFSDIYAVEFHGNSTSSGQVTSIANHQIGALSNVDESGKATGQSLVWNGTNWAPGTVSSTSITEGTNLFYTDARVDARAQLKIDALVGGAPGALDTLNELAAAIGDNANYAASITTALGNKEPIITAGATSQYFRGDKTFQTLNTDAVVEGTNKYFTTARANTAIDARVGGGLGLSSLSDVDTVAAGDDGKYLYYNHASTSFKWASLDAHFTSGKDAIPDADNTRSLGTSSKRFSDIYAVEIHGSVTSAGQAGTISNHNISGLADVSTSAPATGQILKWDGSKWAPANDATAGGSGLDADTLDGQDGTYYLDYNNFTNKPTIPAAYTNASVDTHLNQSNPTSGYVLSWNGSDYAWVAQSGGSALTIQDEGSALSTAASTINFVGAGVTASGTGATKTITINGGGSGSFVGLSDTPANFTGGASKFVKVNAAGNALEYVADPGYLTSVPAQSFASLTGKPTTVAGYGITDAFSGAYADLTGKPTLFDNSAFDTRLAAKTTADLSEGANLYYTNARADARITAAGSANWNTAYGWGDHGAAGYQTTAGLNGAIDTHLNQSNPTSGYVLSWNGSDYAWVTNAGYTNTDFDNRLATKSTTNLSEGTNLYFTDARADARIAAATTDDLSEGSSNLYYTDARANSAFDTRLGTKSTTNLSEGTNLYYTDARADARITNAMVDEDNMASDSNTKVPTQQSVKAYVDSQVASENEISEMNDVTIASIQNNQFLKYNSTSSKWENASVTAATAAGNNTEVQFNDGGVMGSDTGLTYNKASNTLTTTTFVGALTGQASSIANHDTDALSEGSSNLYYTSARANADFDTRLATKSTTNLSEGTNLYYTDARFDTRFTSKDTGDLSEGSNLYFTNARADARITAALIDEDNMATNSATRLPSQQSVKAYVDSQILTKDNTDEMTEGSTNLYFTNARADARIAAASLTTLSNVDAVVAGDDAKILYYDHSSTSFKWKADAGGPADTDALSEGSSNLYFTDARAISAIQGTNINMGSNNITTTGKILYSNVYSALVDLPSASTYHGMFAHVHATGKGYFAHGGSWIELANHSQLSNSSNWDTAYGWGNHASAGYLTNITAQGFTSLSDVDTVAAGDDGKILYYDHSSTSFKWKADAGGPADTDALSEGSSNLYFTDARADARIAASSVNALSDVNTSGASNGKILKYNGTAWVVADDSGGIALTDLSLTTGAASGGGTLSYNNGTGAFTFAPADLTSYLTSTGVLSSHTDVNNASPTDGQVLTWDNSNSYWKPANAAGGEAFKTIAVSGQSDVVADSSSDTLTLVAGSGIVLTTNAGSDSVTVASSVSGGTTYEEFKINYATNGTIASISNETSNITSVNIDSAAGGDLTVNFQNFTTPPLSTMFYGYNYAANEYNMNTLGSTGTTLRSVPGGGSSGSPTAFGSFSSLKIRVSESETGASRSFGTATHAWVRFVMGA